MQTDDRVMVDGGSENRWRGPLVGIAAAAVILIGAAIFFLSNDEPPVATPAPNATELPGEFEPIDPGAYYGDTDGDVATTIRGTFVIEGSGWQSLGVGAWRQRVDNGPYIAFFVTEIDQVWESACGPVGAVQAAATTAEGLADQLAATGLTITEAPAPVSAFGHEGHHLAAEVPAGCHSNENLSIWSSPAWGGRYYQTEGQPVEYWVLDVEGTPVFVEASWFPESSDEDVAELRAVLDTLVITP